MRIVSIGECMVELAPTEGGLYRMGYAGDTFNWAWHMRHLLGGGHEVAYLTAVGDDATSAGMLAFMRREGIDTRHIRTIPGATPGLYLIRQENGDRAFSYWRSQSAARRLAEDSSALNEALRGADLICLSGITLAILDPQSRVLLWEAIAKSGARVAFDPNIRPQLWPDEATCREVLSAAATRSDILLPSFGDEARLFGDGAPVQTAARYAQAGAREIIVKDGGQPAFIRIGAEEFSVAAPEMAGLLVDATGAGDAFNAGWISARLQGTGPFEAARQAHMHASKVLAVQGALLRPPEEA